MTVRVRVRVSVKIRLKSKLREEIVEVTKVVEEVDRISRNIFYLISGGHSGPGFDQFLDYLLFSVFGSF